MAAGDLTTLDTVKEWLGLTDPSQTEDDDLLTRLISAVSQVIATWCARDFTMQSYIETRDGTGGDRMPFINYPVSAVDSLLINGRPIPPAATCCASGYSFTPTMLMLHGYGFNRGHGNVVITYTAGLASIPLDLEQACIELVALRFRDKDRIGLVSKGMAGETTSFIQKDMPDPVKLVLACYKRILPL
ncbi:MAG TPA: head-tail connector protein [Patescibacteria group bacterium]|nr:head-tail connector protein [Patescibacteria group bacterium]